jgi:lipopolysaccharide export system permease protein
MYAVALMALNLAIVGYVQPYARYAYEQLRFDLRSGALGASIKVGEFTNLGRRMTLRVEQSERQGRLLHGVFVRAETRDGKTVIATADHGTFLRTDDPETILLRLANGRLVHNAPGYEAPRVLSFTIQDLPVNLPAIEAFRKRGGSLESEELTLPELLKLFDRHRVDKKTEAAAQAEFHYRLVEIVMMMLMPLLAVALAVPPKRSTSGLGIFLSIVMVVTYHKVNQYGERMAELGRLHPALALWTPFFLFSALIVWMYWTLAYKPGGQPIGGLERVFTRLSKGVARLLRLGQRRLPPGAPAAAE